MNRVRSVDTDIPAYDDPTGLENMRQLIQLRWIAVIGQIVTIAVVHFGFDIQLPLRHMSVVVLCLVVFNIGSLLSLRDRHQVTNAELFVALLVDVATLTVQLYLSGGAANPFSFLYLLQVILGAEAAEARVRVDHGCDHGSLLYRIGVILPAVDTAR